jgi:hypothetical protein
LQSAGPTTASRFAQRVAHPVAQLSEALFRETKPVPVKHALALFGSVSAGGSDAKTCNFASWRGRCYNQRGVAFMVCDCHRAGPTALWNDGALRHSQEAEGAEATKLLRERISKQALRLYVALPEHGPAVPIYLAGRRPELPRRRSPGRSRRIPSQLIQSHCPDSGRSRLRLESGEAIGKRGRRWRMLLHTNHVAVRHSYRHDCRNAPFGVRCWPGRRNRQATNVCCWHRCEVESTPLFCTTQPAPSLPGARVPPCWSTCERDPNFHGTNGPLRCDVARWRANQLDDDLCHSIVTKELGWIVAKISHAFAVNLFPQPIH